MNSESVQLEQKKPENKFEWLYSWFIKIFEVYPVTVVCYIMSSLFSSLVIAMDIDFENFDRSLCVKFTLFFILFSFGSLFTEEVFRHKFSFCKKSFYFVFMIVFGIISLVFAFTLPKISEFNFFGYNDDIIISLLKWFRFVLCYIVLCFFSTIYLIYKRCRAEQNSEILYENYYASVVFRSFKAAIIYNLILVVFLSMISTTVYAVFGEFNPKAINIIHVLSMGFIYFPIMLQIFSSFKKDLSKVLSFIVKYIFLPILLVYFFVMYVCAVGAIFKSFSAGTISCMLAILFIYGRPIWTIGANFKNQIWGKISVALPFVFSPLVILQIICLIIQINETDFNSIHYLQIILIIYQISYLIIYSIKSRKYLQYILFAFAALFLISQVAPFINIYSVTIFPKLSSNRSRENSIYNNYNYDKYNNDNIFKYMP